MGYSYDFKDNTLYGADDINAIRSTIAAPGVIPESSGACLVMYSGDSLMVCKGQALFADGSRIEIDDEGVTLTPTAEVKNYVYLFNDAAKNENSVQISTSAPAGGSDYVPLAEIDESGNITDTRVFSSLKAASSISAAAFSESVTFRSWTSAGETVAEMTLPFYNPSMIAMPRYSSYNTHGTCLYFPLTNVSMNMGISLSGYSSDGNIELSLHSGSGEYTFNITVSGNQLVFKSSKDACNFSGTQEKTIYGYCLK